MIWMVVSVSVVRRWKEKKGEESLHVRLEEQTPIYHKPKKRGGEAR